MVTTPVPPTGGAFAEAGIGKGITPTPLPDHWWRLYNDPVVDRLVEDALAYNTDVRVAAGNLERARAVLSEDGPFTAEHLRANARPEGRTDGRPDAGHDGVERAGLLEPLGPREGG